jgi:hypothetical protein
MLPELGGKSKLGGCPMWCEFDEILDFLLCAYLHALTTPYFVIIKLLENLASDICTFAKNEASCFIYLFASVLIEYDK